MKRVKNLTAAFVVAFVALMVAALTGCATIEADHLRIGIFAPRAKAANPASPERVAFAEQLLCAGASGAQVETLLRDSGTPKDEARLIVVAALAGRKCGGAQ